MTKLIQLKGNRQRAERMKHCGMPNDVFRMTPFDPKFHTLSITSEVEGFRARSVKKAQQLQFLEDILDNPFFRPSYTYVIASNPNDSKAKFVGAAILERAIIMHERQQQPRSRQMPIWHRVYGNYTDRLRDAARHGEERSRPSLLIVSNVTVDSTVAKLELVRDLLDIYEDTPRILIVTGSDPLTFMTTKLRLSTTYCLNLSTAHKVML